MALSSALDPTTDPTLTSFVPVEPDSPFPIQNLPYGSFKPPGSTRARIGVAIGDFVLDLGLLEEQGLLGAPALGGQQVFGRPTLNRFLEAGRPAWREARALISLLLSEGEPALQHDEALLKAALLPRSDVEMVLPVAIGDYTDFYSSREHAVNVGTMFRGADNALMPNWEYLPVGYHGRASSVVIHGTDLHRPQGQTKADGADAPTFGPSRLVDFELEMGFFVGPGNELGAPIAAAEADEHIFGMVLVNDWSARDIQRWEYQPLGPFLAKNFGTSISPWVVTMDALEPFRVPGPVQDPLPLPYLQVEGEWAYDIQLEVSMQGATMPEPHRVCASNFKHLYWSMAQQLAHHSVTGCNMRPGDLLASGTISGPTPDSRGSLLELAWRGTEPLEFPNGETRPSIQDGDLVTMTGWCEAESRRIGFGEVSGRLLPASS